MCLLSDTISGVGNGRLRTPFLILLSGSFDDSIVGVSHRIGCGGDDKDVFNVSVQEADVPDSSK